jgi:hypothetical protein
MIAGFFFVLSLLSSFLSPNNLNLIDSPIFPIASFTIDKVDFTPSVSSVCVFPSESS